MIEVGDIVYQKKRGWSGVPMQVLELNEIPGKHGMFTQALCKGAQGWDVDGLYSEKYRVRVERFAVANLTTVANLALGGRDV